MFYRISKAYDDQCAMSHGYVMPDGYYRIVEVTLHNAEVLRAVASRGWRVEDYTGEQVSGLYRESDDMLVDQWSALERSIYPDREVRAPAANYIDPGLTVGMPPAMVRKFMGKKPVVEDPAHQERRVRLERAAREVEPVPAPRFQAKRAG